MAQQKLNSKKRPGQDKKRSNLLFTLLFILVSGILYSQQTTVTDEITICEGIDSNGNFIGENAKIVNQNFVWYYMKADFSDIDFTEGEILFNNGKDIDVWNFRSSLDTASCLYFMERLEPGVYSIALRVNGNILSISDKFEVK